MKTVDVVRLRWLPVALCAALGAACTTTRVDESRVESAALGGGEKVVVLGRRHNSEYETEPEFVRCVGRGVAPPGPRWCPSSSS